MTTQSSFPDQTSELNCPWLCINLTFSWAHLPSNTYSLLPLHSVIENQWSSVFSLWARDQFAADTPETQGTIARHREQWLPLLLGQPWARLVQTLQMEISAICTRPNSNAHLQTGQTQAPVAMMPWQTRSLLTFSKFRIKSSVQWHVLAGRDNSWGSVLSDKGFS